MIRPPRSGRTSSSQRLAAILTVPMLAGACGAQAHARQTPVAALAPSAQPSPHTSPTPAAIAHVFIIVMENRSYQQALAGAYTAKLASEYGVATNYHGVSHPSLPNYLALTSGSTWGIADDGYHVLPPGGLGQQLDQAGITWRAYMEGMSRTCLSSPYPYALKHDPFPYYGGKCPAQVESLNQYAADMASDDPPRFAWISPGLCNDGHDCSTKIADLFLSRLVPQIMATPQWQDNGVLFITWDEGYDSTNHVLTLVIQPGGTAQRSSVYHDHYSLLATIEDRLGVPRLGQAARATSLSELLVTDSAS